MSARMLLLVGTIAAVGCSGGGGSDASVPTGPPAAAPTPMSVAGTVQKGPFVVGSTVLINRLDSRGGSTPSTLLAEIEDSIGSFSFKTSESGPVQIVASGYYFSELTGQISTGVLTLKALYDVSDDARQKAHVNILTHLINDRVLELISDGDRTLEAAIRQAEDELVTALSDALVIPDLNEFSALSLYDSSDTENNALGNAYLLALSTGFYKYAETKAREFGTATDAELTLTLNRFSDDLADDGRLDPSPFIREFVTAIRSLSPTTIATNLRSRSLVDYPQGLGIPDISIFLSLCAGNFDCAWSAGAPMPSPSAGHLTAVLGEKAYVFGGFNPPAPCCNQEAHAYDPVANKWTPARSMPVGAREAAAHTLGDKIYVAIGMSPLLQVQNGLYAYDPASDQWTTRAARPTYRTRFASATLNGLLYVFGGYGAAGNGPGGFADGELKSHVEVYDPTTNSWSTGTPMPMALSGAQTCVFGNDIYLFGGSSAGNAQERSILTYNTVTNTWSAKSPMPTTRVDFSCVAVDGAAYLVGGSGYTPSYALMGTIERYDPFVETWTSPARLQTPRASLSAISIGHRLFTFGGMSPNPGPGTDVVEILDLAQL
jgi:hypothetical protein